MPQRQRYLTRRWICWTRLVPRFTSHRHDQCPCQTFTGLTVTARTVAEVLSGWVGVMKVLLETDKALQNAQNRQP